MRLLADDQFAAAVAGVEPFGVGHGAAARAVEANPGAEFDEGASLRQFDGLFVLDADPGRTQTILLGRDGADQNLIAAGSSANLPPVPRSQGDDSHEQDRGQHHGKDDEKALLHGGRGGGHKHAGHTLGQKQVSVKLRRARMGCRTKVRDASGESSAIVVCCWGDPLLWPTSKPFTRRKWSRRLERCFWRPLARGWLRWNSTPGCRGSNRFARTPAMFGKKRWAWLSSTPLGGCGLTSSSSKNILLASAASSISGSIFAARISSLPAGGRCWRFLMERRAATQTLPARWASRMRFALWAWPTIATRSRLWCPAIA